MPTRSENDLDWLACRYALGELPGTETAAFEARLDADQVAREAVARAVALLGVVALAAADRPTALVMPARRRRRTRAWAAVAAAASIVIGSTAWLATSPPPEAETGRVASAWSGLRDRPRLDGDEDSNAPVPSAEIEPIADRPLPSWLIAGAGGFVSHEESPRVED